MKSKKLMLVISSFVIVGSLASCNGGGKGGDTDKGEIKAEIKDNRRYSIGEKITNDDIRVTYIKGNSTTPLNSDEFTVTGFENNEYTFKNGDGKLGKRTRSFEVSAKNLTTTFDVEAFNGEVSHAEFVDALLNVVFDIPNRNYILDETISASGATEKCHATIEGEKNLFEYSFYDEQGKVVFDDMVAYNRFRPDLGNVYLLYGNDNPKKDFKYKEIDTKPMLESEAFYKNYYLLPYFFDNAIFDNDKREYTLEVKYEDVDLKCKFAFDSDLHLTYIKEFAIDKATSKEIICKSLEFSDYGKAKIDTTKLPKEIEVHEMKADDKGIFKFNITFTKDSKELFVVRLPKTLQENVEQKIYILNGTEKYYDLSKLQCFVEGTEIKSEHKIYWPNITHEESSKDGGWIKLDYEEVENAETILFEINWYNAPQPGVGELTVCFEPTYPEQ